MADLDLDRLKDFLDKRIERRVRTSVMTASDPLAVILDEFEKRIGTYLEGEPAACHSPQDLENHE